MPLYEFRCDDCEEEFEKLVRSASAVSEVNCPSCGSPKVIKRMSSFAAAYGGSRSPYGSSSSSECSTGST
jgi:putative FmdB family regulatory protein